MLARVVLLAALASGVGAFNVGGFLGLTRAPALGSPLAPAAGMGLCGAVRPRLEGLAGGVSMLAAAAKGDKPKRPLSAYFLYAKDARAGVKAANPALSNTDIVKKLGEQWRGLSASEKKKYEDTAKAARDEYNAKYKPAKKDDKPKKPLSAYMIYSNTVRPEVTKANPTAKFGDIAKIIGAQWRALTPAQKEPFIKKEFEGKAAAGQ